MSMHIYLVCSLKCTVWYPKWIFLKRKNIWSTQMAKLPKLNFQLQWGGLEGIQIIWSFAYKRRSSNKKCWIFVKYYKQRYLGAQTAFFAKRARKKTADKKMRASWYVKTKYEPASIYQFRSAVAHFMSLATLFWWTTLFWTTLQAWNYDESTLQLTINHSMLWWSYSFHKLKQKVWHRAPKGRACIKRARQKGVSVKNVRGKSSARGAENAVWLGASAGLLLLYIH